MGQAPSGIAVPGGALPSGVVPSATPLGKGFPSATPFGGEKGGSGLLGVPQPAGITPFQAAELNAISQRVTAASDSLSSGQIALANQTANLSNTVTGLTGAVNQGFGTLSAGQASLLQQGQETRALLSSGLRGLSATTQAGFAGTQSLIGTAALGTQAAVQQSNELLTAGQRTLALGQAGLAQATGALGNEVQAIGGAVGNLQTILLVGGAAAAGLFLYSQQEGEGSA